MKTINERTMSAFEKKITQPARQMIPLANNDSIDLAVGCSEAMNAN